MKALETKIMKIRPFNDKKGRYISYCDFGYHQGVVRNPLICEDRICKHYKKLYIHTLQDLERAHKEIMIK